MYAILIAIIAIAPIGFSRDKLKKAKPSIQRILKDPKSRRAKFKAPKLELNKKENSRIQKTLKKALNLGKSDVDFGYGWFDQIKNQKWAMVPSFGIGIFYASGNQYRRYDKYRLALSTDPAGIFNKLPLYGVFATLSDAELMRYFPSPEEAYKSTPSLKIAPPLTAALAQKLLKPEELFRSTLNLNVLVGSTIPIPFSPTFGYYHNTEMVLSGKFQFEMLALNDNRFRVRLGFIRSTTKSLSESLSSLYIVSQIDILQKTISNLIYLNLANISIGKTNQNGTILDYIYDFNNAKAREAYNALFFKSKIFRKSVNFGFLGKGERPLPHKFISDINLSDKLAKKDQDKPAQEKRVANLFNGSLDYIKKHYSKDFGFIFYNRYFSKSKTKYRIQNGKNAYYFDIKSKFSGNKKAGGVQPNWKAEEHFNYIPLTQKKGSNSIFGYFYKFRQHSYNRKDHKIFVKKLRRILPDEVVDKIPMDTIKAKLQPTENIKLSFSYKLDSKILNKLRRNFQSCKDIRNGFSRYQTMLKNQKLWKKNYRIFHWYYRVHKRKLIKELCRLPKKSFKASLAAFDKQEFSTAESIKQIFSRSNSEELSTLVDLKDNILFRKIGYGFLFYILGPETMKKYTQINLFAASPHWNNDISFEYGNLDSAPEFDKITGMRWGLDFAPTQYENSN